MRNAILNKELKLGARTIRFPLAISLYSLIMCAVAMVILLDTTNYTYAMHYGATRINYNNLTQGFTVLSCVQAVIICIVIPIITASSISGEREKQTLDIMLTAPISPLSIVLGKLGAALANVFMFVISSLPAMSICFLYGGIEWKYLFVFMIEIMAVAFMVGAIGVWCSAVFKRTIVSVIMTMILELNFYLTTIIIVFGIYWAKYYQYITGIKSMPAKGLPMGLTPLILLLNPAIGFGDAVFKSTSGFSVMDRFVVNGLMSHFHENDLIGFVVKNWTVFSILTTILVGFLFVYLAARKIDSVRLKGKTMKNSNR